MACIYVFITTIYINQEMDEDSRRIPLTRSVWKASAQALYLSRGINSISIHKKCLQSNQVKRSRR